ncbi:MAG: HD domain-containing protein [Patescibacteria group bacterium]|mgnify:CR=1 FL=1
MLEKVKALLKGAENRETFFRRIASFLPPMDPRYKLIERAYDAAKDAFHDKKRESGERYFEHLRAVAIILIDYLRKRDHILIIAALLHDIVEDNPSWTIERVRLEFGDDAALLVDYLSKPSKKDYPSEEERLKVYRDRFPNAPRGFFFIKLSDNLHNNLTIWQCSPEKIARKTEETKRYYLPFAEKECILLHELEAAVQELKSLKLP